MTHQGEPISPRVHGEVGAVQRKEQGKSDKKRGHRHSKSHNQSVNQSVNQSLTVRPGHAAEPRIERALLRDEAQAFILARRQVGIVTADAEWVDTPFDDWLAALCGQDEMSVSSMARLAVGMSLSLPIRDALIISLVARQDISDAPVSKQLMVTFASRPHEPRNVASMSDMLSRAFEHRHVDLDVRRCRRGIDILTRMVRVLPEEYTVQPLAVLAYVTWWMNDERACAYALSALRLDENCTLAGIVCAALGQGL